MKKSFLTTCVISIIFIFGVVTASRADYIVDTGEPPYLGQWALRSDQWLAGQITLDNAYSITDIYGYFRTDGGTLTLVLYGDNDSGLVPLPDESNELFHGGISVPATAPPGESNAWCGLSGLDLNLLAGPYWVAFEVRPGDTYNGAMSVRTPNPLDAYALKGPPEHQSEHYRGSISSFGLRVEGSPIPIPGAVWLLGSGFLGLVGLRKKIKK